MTPAGFPHSDIHGSQFASNSPWHFAGSRVLHRRLVPRHSPCALSTLTSTRALVQCAYQVPYSHGVRFEARGSSRQPRPLVHPQRTSYFFGLRLDLSIKIPRDVRLRRFLLLFVFAALELSGNAQGLALKTGNGRDNQDVRLAGLTYEFLTPKSQKNS
jgi:hypothetical protein